MQNIKRDSLAMPVKGGTVQLEWSDFSANGISLTIDLKECPLGLHNVFLDSSSNCMEECIKHLFDKKYPNSIGKKIVFNIHVFDSGKSASSAYSAMERKGKYFVSREKKLFNRSDFKLELEKESFQDMLGNEC